MPLQRRPFVHTRPIQTAPAPSDVKASAGTAGGGKKTSLMGDRSRDARVLPPPGLKSVNEACKLEPIRVVTTFLDEDDGGVRSVADGEVGAVAGGGAEGCTTADGSAETVCAPSSHEEDAAPRSPRASPRLRRSQRSSMDSSTGTASGADTGVGHEGSPGSVTVRRSPKASLRSSPRRLLATSQLYDASAQGRGQSPSHAPSRLQSCPEKEAQVAERTHRVMSALCRQAYQSIPQVERRIFSGDVRPPGTPADLAASPSSQTRNRVTTEGPVTSDGEAPAAGGLEEVAVRDSLPHEASPQPGCPAGPGAVTQQAQARTVGDDNAE